MSEQLQIPSSNQLKKAGNIIRESKDELSVIKAIETVTRWRNLHTAPLNSLQMSVRLKLSKTVYKNCLIVQRLKRMPSIILKIKRFPTMSLARMQDIGGIRIIANNVKDVYKIHELITGSKSVFEQTNTYHDYINKPKPDGYRSLHQVFKYVSPTKPELNGLHFEVQIRTKLQHAWATAVETLSIIENESFKTGGGSYDYKQFFKIVSTLFALEEGTTPLDEYKKKTRIDLCTELMLLEKSLHVIDKLSGLATTLRHITSNKQADKAQYYVLELVMDPQYGKNSLYLSTFQNKYSSQAEDYYHSREVAVANDPYRQVLMISAVGVKNIRKAYPNFFLDTTEFIKRVKSAIASITINSIKL